MKKRITGLLLFVFFSLLLVSCKNTNIINGEGEYIFKEQELNNDTSLIVENIVIVDNENIIPVAVNIKGGTEKKLVIEAQESIMDYINIDETLGLLTISSNPNNNFVTEKIVINIYGIAFTNIVTNLAIVKTYTYASNTIISLKKASKLVADTISTKSLNVTLDNSCYLDVSKIEVSDFTLVIGRKGIFNINDLVAQNSNIQVTNANCNIVKANIGNSRFNLTEGAEVIVSGVSKTVDVSITGESTYYGKENVSDSATLIAAGNSYVEICANTTINVIDTGAKEIKYFGDAVVTKTNILVK